MFIALIISGVLTYTAIGAWTFGYVSGLDGRGEDPTDKGYSKQYYGLNYYRNEEKSWFPAILWPVTLLYYLFIKRIACMGYSRGCKTLQARRVRIEIEKKIRVEQEKIEREAEEEIETELRKHRAA